MAQRELCPDCSGRGICWHCSGTGVHRITYNGRKIREACPACRGVGDCPTCAGKGWVATTERRAQAF